MATMKNQGRQLVRVMSFTPDDELRARIEDGAARCTRNISHQVQYLVRLGLLVAEHLEDPALPLAENFLRRARLPEKAA